MRMINNAPLSISQYAVLFQLASARRLRSQSLLLSPARSVTQSLDRSANKCQERTARMCQSNSARMCQGRNVRRFPSRAARLCRTKWRDRWLGRSVMMCPGRNADRYPTQVQAISLRPVAKLSLRRDVPKYPRRLVATTSRPTKHQHLLLVITLHLHPVITLHPPIPAVHSPMLFLLALTSLQKNLIINGDFSN